MKSTRIRPPHFDRPVPRDEHRIRHDRYARVIAALNLGGLIVIDFLNLETKAERGLLTEHLRDALVHPVCQSDAEPVNHLGIGLVTRARRGFSIPEQQRALLQIQDRVPLPYATARAASVDG